MITICRCRDILKQYSRLNCHCINSVGNGLIIDTNTETPVIQSKNGFGGIGGSVVKATTLANVVILQFIRK